jgi:glycosyltransferase involved in cell wall biosynthesis
VEEAVTDRPVGSERPIRVAYLHGSLEIGGSERQMVELARRLPRDTFAPEFVLLDRRGPLADLAEANGVPVTVLDWTPSGTPWPRLRKVRDLARYVTTMRQGRYDIIDAWLFHAYALAAAARTVTRVPAIIAGRRNLSGPGGHPVNRLLDNVARRRVDVIVANSEGVRREVIRRENVAPGRIRVIHNGVELPAQLTPGERDAIRARWGAGPDSIVIGCVANYRPEKGLGAVIEVASQVTAAVEASIFVLIGEGPLRADLARAIDAAGLGDRVRLHGREPDARAILGGLDIALQASLAEGMPNAVLEAAAAGLPVVATDVGGTAEIVTDGSTGRLVAPGDIDAMAEALMWLAASRDRRLALGAAARMLVADRFGMDRFVAETTALYEQVLAGRAWR